MFGPIDPYKRSVKVATTNPCKEIILAGQQICGLGYTCIACEKMLVGSKDSICELCMSTPRYSHQTHYHIHIGMLLDNNFYCLDCESWFGGHKDKVIMADVGIFSQICICCRQVIVAGKIPSIIFPADYKNSRRVLGQ